MFSKWYGILWKSRSLEFYQINEMFKKSARDSSTRIQKQIYSVSRDTARHLTSANCIFLFPFSFFFFFSKKGLHIKEVSIIDGALWTSADVLGGQMEQTQHYSSIGELLPNFWELMWGLCWDSPPMTEVILFSSGGLGLEQWVLIFLPALCFKTRAKPSLLRPAWELRLAVVGCEEPEALGWGCWSQLSLEATRKKCSLADGSSLSHPQGAAWIFPMGTTVRDQL